MSRRRYTKTAIREALWVTANLAPGTPWAAGGMDLAREAELVRMGIFVPTGDPALYVVARAEIPAMPPRTAGL